MSNDNIYVDLLLTNTVQTLPNDRVPVKFSLNQSQNIVDDTTGYELSVIRFSLNTETLPIFIPHMKESNSFTTIYSCTFEYNGVIFQQYMEFIPQNSNPIDKEEEFYVYSYQYVVYLFNNMLKDCLLALNDISDTGISVAPIMFFNTETQICGMSMDSTEYGFNETGKINISMNTQMYALLSTLPASIIHSSLGRDYQLNNMISSNPDVLVQEYTTVELWNPVASIVFTTNTLPIYTTNTAPIQVYVDGKLSESNSTYNFLNIMTDFIGNDLIFTPFVEYAPSIYRFLSIKQGVSIRNIDLQVLWMNRNDGQLRPLYLIPGGSCSVKLYLKK